MSSGQIKGIGPKTAEKIYHAFGNDTLKILDEEPPPPFGGQGHQPDKAPGWGSGIPTWPAGAPGMW